MWPSGWPIAALGLLAAIAYSSWPLGYYLNPRVGSYGYASELGAFGQPYNWVFIVGDVVAGFLILVISWLLYRHFRTQLFAWHKRMLLLFAAFGALTIMAALMPMRCTPSISICAPAFEDAELIMHDIVSVAAGVAIFATVYMVWKRYDRDERMFFMNFIMAAIATFGILSFFYSIIPGPAYLAQRYFLVATCLWVFVLPTLFIRNKILFEKRPRHVK